MAAGYCALELERVANHLLPPEIIEEIGIVDDTVDSAAAAIEGLAAHLASILGLASMRTQHRPRPANATPHDQYTSRVLPNNGGMMARAAPGSGRNRNGDIVLCCPGTVKVFATTPVAAPSPANAGMPPPETERRHQSGSGTGVFLPAMRHDRHGGGTGVFMPLAGAYRTSSRPFKSRGSKGLKPPRLMRKEAAE